MSRGAPLALMLAGGTGGHVYPALAVALTLRERGFQLAWIGTSRGLESRVLGAARIPLHELPMRGLRGKSLWQKISGVFLLSISTLLSLGLMLRLRPSVVIGMGGYASFPAAIAAWILRRPLLLQEQNAVAGSANRALARCAGGIATGFPGVLAQYPVTRYLGNPVREDLLAVAEQTPVTPRGDRALRVLVLGGSLGAQPLNEGVPAVAAALGEQCEWRHQCGADHHQATMHAYRSAGVHQWQVHPFLDDMAEAYAWADVVVCRAGALTVAELAVTARPAILIPLPYAIDDHQTENARYLADAGAAVLMPQDQLSDQLPQVLRRLLSDDAQLLAMSASARQSARPDASSTIAAYAQELMR